MTDNMKLWDAVSKTNPAHTKHVNQRGGFTAINANAQIMEATRQFGAVGVGWGYTSGEPIFHDALVIVPVTFWHGTRENVFGPIYGAEEWKDKNGRIDSDAPKKATTDALTKALSQLGFNADVFLGLYDDQKYVSQVRAEFAEKGREEAPKSPLISDDQRDELMQLAQAAGVVPLVICETYGVADFRELTLVQYEAARKRLNLTIDQRIKEPA